MIKHSIFIALIASTLSCGPSSHSKNEETDGTPPLTDAANNDRADALEKGRMLSQRAAETLNARLVNALQNGSTKQAVAFCSERGIPLLDSLAEIHQVSFKRAAIKYRNPLNEADSLEESAIAQYERRHSAGEVLHPELIAVENGRWKFFSPILTAPHCLQCHGKEIDPEVSKQIRILYPNDRAIGFETGQLRGIWSLEL